MPALPSEVDLRGRASTATAGSLRGAKIRNCATCSDRAAARSAHMRGFAYYPLVIVTLRFCGGHRMARQRSCCIVSG